MLEPESGRYITTSEQRSVPFHGRAGATDLRELSTLSTSSLSHGTLGGATFPSLSNILHVVGSAAQPSLLRRPI